MSIKAVLAEDQAWHVECGNALAVLHTIPDETVHTCVTSPPYFGLRDYGVGGQLGQERTVDEYVARLVEIFEEVRRTLRRDGTLWLNLGDSYAKKNQGFKRKDLVGIPWKVAFALRAAGWTLRADIVWAKPNPMPEAVKDRPTKSHEYVFLLSKSPDYYYDADAVKEPVSGTAHARGRGVHAKSAVPGIGIKSNRDFSAAVRHLVARRNLRSVWTVAVHSVREAHFATYPPALVRPCILAGTSAAGACGRCGAPHERVLGERLSVEGAVAGNAERTMTRTGEHARRATHLGLSLPWSPTDTPTIGWHPTCSCSQREVPCVVIDPFCGAGTTGMVAGQLGRRFIGIELSPDYAAIARRRIASALPMQLAAAL